MTVTLKAKASRSLPASGGSLTVGVSIEPISKTKPTTRHIALLIDTSGSMAGTKIENAKQGAIKALKEVEDDDYVSIVGFDSTLDVVLPMTRWGDSRQSEAKQKVKNIRAGGGTDIYKGLEKVREQLIEDAPSDARAVKRIILLSDGQDRYTASTYRDLATDFDEDGISIMAAGIGKGYDEAVMLALANGSGGIPTDLSEDDIDEFLGETVSQTDTVIAPNPSLLIEPDLGFIVEDEPAYFSEPKVEERPIENDVSPTRIDLPELQLESPHELTFKMLGQPKSAGLTHDLANLKLVDSTRNTLAETSVTVDYTAEGAIERIDIEKSRAEAKITRYIQDDNISEREVNDAINEIEIKGWNKTAARLQNKKSEAKKAGGIIRISKRDK